MIGKTEVEGRENMGLKDWAEFKRVMVCSEGSKIKKGVV